MFLPVNDVSDESFGAVCRIFVIDGFTAHHKRPVFEIDGFIFLVILAFPDSDCLPICYCGFILSLVFGGLNFLVLDE